MKNIPSRLSKVSTFFKQCSSLVSSIAIKRSYSSQVKPKPVDEITSIKDVIDILEQIQNGKYNLLPRNTSHLKNVKSPVNKKLSLWFRGQPDINWSITSSLFRGSVDLTTPEKKSNTLYYLDEQAAVNYLKSTCPSLNQHNLFELLTIAQHHGLPTRLLDWSLSAINAMLFAVMDKTHEADGEFFILNPAKLNYYTMGEYEICGPDHPEVALRAELSNARNYDDLLSSSFTKGYVNATTQHLNTRDFLKFKYSQYIKSLEHQSNAVMLTEEAFYNQVLAHPVALFPLWKDKRLQVQQGTFLIEGGKFTFSNYAHNPLPTPKSIFEIQHEAQQQEICQHGSLTGESTFILSYKIPKEYKYKIVRELRRLGVNYGLLFPELEHQTKYAKFIWSYPSSGEREKLLLPEEKKLAYDSGKKLMKPKG